MKPRDEVRVQIFAAAVSYTHLDVYKRQLLSVLPGLPPLDVVTDYQPKIPLRVYSADGALLAEFGEEHRDFVPIQDIPQVMKDALLAIEDSRFYEHGGVDYLSLIHI